MARKFWERINNNLIQFYDEPQREDRQVLEDRISELQTILALPDAAKALLVQANPAITTEEEWNAQFQDEIDQLADILDYWLYDTVEETIDVVSSGWIRADEFALGLATVVDWSAEEDTASPQRLAVHAFDGQNNTNWQSDRNPKNDSPPGVHYLVLDIGYSKRIDGIRFKNPNNPGNPFILSEIQVYVANNMNGLLNNPNAHVGVDLAMGSPQGGNVDFDLPARSGRYVRVEIGATAHPQNHITIREIELRCRARTFGL